MRDRREVGVVVSPVDKVGGRLFKGWHPMVRAGRDASFMMMDLMPRSKSWK